MAVVGPRGVTTMLHNLPEPMSPFVGRAKELAGLAAALDSATRDGVAIVAIIGTAVVGKSRLALAYAHARIADYDLIRWVRAGDPWTLAADYVGLAPDIGLKHVSSPQEALVRDVRAAFEGGGRWLLVLDDARGPEVVEPYLPRRGGGHVLITSECLAWDDTVGGRIELEPLAIEDAAALLLGEGANADTDQRAAAEDLAAGMGRLPLALCLARAWIRAQGTTPAAYRAALGETGATLAACWRLSVDAARAACPGAVELLEILAFFGPGMIPRGRLGECSWNLPKRLREKSGRDAAIAALARYGLIQATSETITVHRLIQAVTRDSLDQATARARVATAVRLVEAMWPQIVQNDHNWPLMTDLLPHALAAVEHADALGVEPAAVGRFLHEVALYHCERAAWAEAEPLLARAIAMGGHGPGSGGSDLAGMLASLAWIYEMTDREHEVEPLYRRAIAIEEEELGPEHPQVATYLNNLALRLGSSRLAEAEALLKRAIAIDEKAFGPASLQLAAEIGNLGWLYHSARRWHDAEPLFVRCVAVVEATFGPDHPEAAERLANLGLLYWNMGRPAEAEPHYRRAVMVWARALPSNDAVRIDGLETYARLLDELGRSDDAARARQGELPSSS